MDYEAKPLPVAHLETPANVPAAAVSELQAEIDKIVLLSEEEYKLEERKLLRKVCRSSVS